MHHGFLPVNSIDHINGVEDDNRIENLRDVTHRQNCQNHKSHIGGRLFGTSFERGLYRARVQVNGKRLSLGFYKTEKEAHDVYVKYIKDNKL